METQDNGQENNPPDVAGVGNSRTELLPVEVLGLVLSNLSFGDVIRYGGASTTTRTQVHNYRYFGHVLSNDDGRLILSEVLNSYQDHIVPEVIREIELIANIPRSDEKYIAGNLELEQVFRWLEYRECTSIQKAKIHMHFFSHIWLNSLISIASVSLTELSLLTTIDPTRISNNVLYLLSNFGNLTSLYFGTKLRSARDIRNPPLNRNNLDIRNRNTLNLFISGPSFQHTNLITLHLESDEQFVYRLHQHGLFRHLPNLQNFTFTGGTDFWLIERPGAFYEHLFEFCPLLKSFTFHHRDYEEYRRESDPDMNHDELPPASNNTIVQQTGNLIKQFQFNSRYDGSHVDSSYYRSLYRINQRHFSPILNAYHTTLAEMNLAIYGYIFLEHVMCMLNFPQLRRLTLALRHLQSPGAIFTDPYYSIGPVNPRAEGAINDWMRLLRNMPNLNYLKLIGPRPQFGVSDAIQNTLIHVEFVRLEWNNYQENTTHTSIVISRARPADWQNRLL
ncbi:hypothetical protein BJV82DRAFT_671961 [Fennellomyces sp. T-0311]|nr:hypothetical protein BJV82DRAFT_671961 [Fennellomyces sp. T-0311]